MIEFQLPKYKLMWVFKRA